MKYSIPGDDGILVKIFTNYLYLKPLRIYILEIYRSQTDYIFMERKCKNFFD